MVATDTSTDVDTKAGDEKVAKETIWDVKKMVKTIEEEVMEADSVKNRGIGGGGKCRGDGGYDGDGSKGGM